MKTKLIFLTALLLLLGTVSFAQDRTKPLEFEPAVGVGYPTVTTYEGTPNPFFAASLSLRFAVGQSPFRVGAQASFHRTIGQPAVESLDYRSLIGTVLAEYRITKGEKVRPFVGAGIGYMYHFKNETAPTAGKGNICFVPHVGIQIGKHFRITIEDTIAFRHFNAIQLKAGWQF